MSSTDREKRLAAELEVMRELAKESSILQFESEGDEFEPSGDLEKDLMALGLGELPTEELLEPMGDETTDTDMTLGSAASQIPPAPVEEMQLEEEAQAEIPQTEL